VERVARLATIFAGIVEILVMEEDWIDQRRKEIAKGKALVDESKS